MKLKSLVSLSLMFPFLAAAELSADCSDRVARAEANVQYLGELFSLGRAGVLDLWKADILLLDEKFSCQLLVQGDATIEGSYCERSSEEKRAGFVAGIKEEVGAGLRASYEEQQAVSMWNLYREICN